MSEFVVVARRHPIAVITLNRPAVLNAWHAAMRAELRHALRALDDAAEVRAIIITGAGDRAFSAGQDLNETMAFDEARAERWIEEWRALYGTFRSLSKPLIAALNGVAAGSGFQAALLCDVRIGHTGSRMGQPEINAGIPSTLGPWLMQASIGLSRTAELTLSGRLMDGEECHRLGLIHHLVAADHVMAKAFEVALELAAKPPLAMQLNKRRFRELTEAGFEEALAAGTRMQHEAYGSGEPQRMMERFLAAKRPANR